MGKVGGEEGFNVIKIGINPDCPRRSSNLFMRGFLFGFHKVGDYGRAEVPLAEYCRRVVGWEDFESRYGVGGNGGGASNVFKIGGSAKCPEGDHAEGDNKIGVGFEEFVG